MVNISKKKLPKRQEEKLFQQMSEVVGGLNKKNSVNFLKDLLSETEQVMFAKRLSVVLMLHEGCSLYKIWNDLHVSPTTVSSMYDNYVKGEYDEIIRIFCKKKQDREKFWSTLELISRGGLPPMGKDRWKTLNKILKS